MTPSDTDTTRDSPLDTIFRHFVTIKEPENSNRANSFAHNVLVLEGLKMAAERDSNLRDYVSLFSKSLLTL